MKHPRIVIPLAAVFTAGVALAMGLFFRSWQRRLPAEYQTLQALLQRLSQGNDLGHQPMSFMVGSGTYTAQLAEQRGLCKPGRCDMFAQLNPYQHYGNGWDELIRQGYALGDIQGWSASSGTVVLTRAGFRAYGPHSGYLACTIAHEIAHFRRYHVFEQSYYDNQNLQGLPSRHKKIESMKRSRQQELEADRDAATMLARAGFRGRVCQQALAFMARSVGDGSATEEDSTHPGYEERLSAMRVYYDSLERHPPKPQPSSTVQFLYNSADNLLTLLPQRP